MTDPLVGPVCYAPTRVALAFAESERKIAMSLRPESRGTGTNPAYAARDAGPLQSAKLSAPTKSQAAVTSPLPGALVRHASDSAHSLVLSKAASSASRLATRRCEIGDELGEMLPHACHHHRPLEERVALVAGLCPHRQQPVTRHRPLAGIVAHRRWWRPRGGLELRRQAGEVRRVRRVGLGPAQLRLGEMVRLLRVDHRDPVARLVRRDGEGDPIIAGRLQDGERRSRWHARGLEVPLERRKARRGLRSPVNGTGGTPPAGSPATARVSAAISTPTYR